MDPKEQLNKKKDNILNQIAEFAKRGESQKVLAAGEKLNQVEKLIERYEKLVQDISNFDKEPPQKTEAIINNWGASAPIKTNIVTVGRGIGKTARMAFLEKAYENGIHLQNIRGSIYQAESGRRVGIAVATERKANRWFLGLPQDRFEDVVLLCKPDSGETIEIILPQFFFSEHGDRMSKSSGQVKFNVARRGNVYVLLVPETDGISLSEYIGNFSLLK